MPKETYILSEANDLRALRLELQRILDSIATRLNFIDFNGDDVTLHGTGIVNLATGVDGSDAIRRDQILDDGVLDSLIINGLTPSRIVATNSIKQLVSVALASWVDGTTDQITVTNDGDGSITLSTPQDIATSSSPLFNFVKQTAPYHAFGGFQEQAQQVAIAASNTWYHITNGTNDLWTGTEATGISISNDVLTITNAGDYSGAVSLTMYGSASQDYEVRIYNVTQAAQAGYFQGLTGTGANNYVNVTLPIYLEAAVNDQFRLEVRNISGTGDVYFDHAVFYVQYLHE